MKRYVLEIEHRFKPSCWTFETDQEFINKVCEWLDNCEIDHNIESYEDAVSELGLDLSQLLILEENEVKNILDSDNDFWRGINNSYQAWQALHTTYHGF